MYFSSHIFGLRECQIIDREVILLKKPSVSLLKHLSTIVRTLQIHQKPILGLPAYPGTNYLFGVSGLDWAPIIVEMFSGKLDKVWISNFEYPDYISPWSYDTLINVSSFE